MRPIHRQSKHDHDTSDADVNIAKPFFKVVLGKSGIDARASVTCLVFTIALAMHRMAFVATIMILILHVGARRCTVLWQMRVRAMQRDGWQHGNDFLRWSCERMHSTRACISQTLSIHEFYLRSKRSDHMTIIRLTSMSSSVGFNISWMEFAEAHHAI